MAWFPCNLNSNLGKLDTKIYDMSVSVRGGYAMPESVTINDTFKNALALYLNTPYNAETEYSIPLSTLELNIQCSDASFSYERLDDGSYLMHNPNGATVTVGYKGRETGTSIIQVIKIN